MWVKWPNFARILAIPQQEAQELAAQIRTQLPLHHVLVMHSADRQQAPHDYFVAIKRSVDDKNTLFIHSRYEWTQALLAWDIIRD